MKICIYGAGAIGGLIGTRLGAAGHDVSAVARGTTLEALRLHGLRLQLGDELVTAAVKASDDPTDLGIQDVVVIAVKATALTDIAPRVGPLLGPDTVVMTAMNGVPWWFFEGFGGEYAGMCLESVDPGGALAAAMPAHHIVGCVVHLTCAVVEPGFMRLGAGNHLIVGEPDGRDSARLRRVAGALEEAGFDVARSESIQRDMWFKLWGNMTMNPISALTGATCDRILDDLLVNRFCLDIMGEAARIGAKIGAPITQSGEERNAVTRQLGAFKTSMLRDVEAERPVELDALVTVVREIGQKVGEPTPSIDVLLGLARLHAQVRGLYPWSEA